MEILINQAEKPELDEMKDFVKSLTEEQKQKLQCFILGIKFAKSA